MKYILAFILFAFTTISAFSQDSVPKNIDAAVDRIIKDHGTYIDTSRIFIFESLGMGIRNSWIRGNRDTALVNQFHKLNIFEAHDMSSIILQLASKRLHHVSENFDSLILEVANREKGQVSESNQLNKEVQERLKHINDFKIGDSIRAYIPIDTFIWHRTFNEDQIQHIQLADNRMIYEKIEKNNDP